MRTKFISILILFFIILLSCETTDDDIALEQSLNKEIATKEPIYMEIDNASWSFADSNVGQELLKSTADKSENRQVVLYSAEYITSGDSEEAGNIIYFNNRGNKQLGADFVADSQYLVIADEDNPCGIYTDKTNDISYYVDERYPSNDLGPGISTTAIDRAMTTWNEVSCSELGIFKRPFDSAIRTGVAAGRAHPICDWAADVVHAGWMPLGFFNWFSRGNGANILGVTFTFIVAIDGVPSDDDNDGKADVWFREIYYNEAFSWKDGGTTFPDIDIETVALHEAGHGLSQGHFGKAFASGNFDKDNVKVHFSPRAVMNASYTGIQTKIGKTDNGGHCSNWGNWPNN